MTACVCVLSICWLKAREEGGTDLVVEKFDGKTPALILDLPVKYIYTQQPENEAAFIFSSKTIKLSINQVNERWKM